jgi:REP element-mobilizing transposase RayT
MRSRYRVLQEHHAHFVTATIVAWLPVFTTAARCDIIVGALTYCRAHKELKIHAWVILDNHFHAIVSARDLSRVLTDLKRHTASQLVEQLESEGCAWLLHQLRHFRLAHKSESVHQVWQEGSHPSHDERCDHGTEAGVPAQQSGEARIGGVAGALALLLGARMAAGGLAALAGGSLALGREAVQLPGRGAFPSGGVADEVQLRKTSAFPSAAWERGPEPRGAAGT